jgi:hypothetical protein
MRSYWLSLQTATIQHPNKLNWTYPPSSLSLSANTALLSSPKAPAPLLLST